VNICFSLFLALGLTVEILSEHNQKNSFSLLNKYCFDTIIYMKRSRFFYFVLVLFQKVDTVAFSTSSNCGVSPKLYKRHRIDVKSYSNFQTSHRHNKIGYNDSEDIYLRHSTDNALGAQTTHFKSVRIQQVDDRYLWLRKATSNLLDTNIYPPGSLTKGKWHELNSMLVAWSKWMEEGSSLTNYHDRTQIPLLMETILKRIIDERFAGNFDVAVTKHMYNLVLESWLHSISPSGNNNVDGAISVSAAQRALDIVKHMQSRSEIEEDLDIRPNLYSMITILKMWTRSSALTTIPPSASNKLVLSHVASRRAHQTIQYMEYLDRSGRNVDVKPNVLAYSLVMDAFAKSGEKDAGSKAESLLRHAQSLGVEPNLFCYNMVIHAYCRQGRRGGAVDHAERILNEIEEKYEKTGDASLRPDVVTYTSVISAWANSNRRGYAAKQAEEILNRMKDSSPPNTVTYNAVLKAWCRSGEKNAAKRALDIFKRMETEHLKGNQMVQPDRITFNTLIHALSKSGKSEDMNHAEVILSQMKSEGLAPNVFTYNTIIEGWSKVKDSDGSFKAYNMLKKMLDAEKEDKSIHVKAVSVNHVIFSFSRSGLKSSALRAEELLRFMEREYRNGNKKLKPDVFGYSAAIHAWANSGDEDAGERAEALLYEMEKRHADGETDLKPNTGMFVNYLPIILI
jgi:pentatricopeptide repeat protein